MIVKLSEFTKAVAKIQAMASGEKTVPGIMLDISDDGVKVCYSDSRKALIEKIDAVVEDTDIRGKIVLDYGRVVSAITICQPSGRLSIEDLQFIFEPDGKVTLYADKLLLVSSENGEDEYIKVSTFEQLLTWTEAGSSMRTAMLSRENYDSIFQPAGGYDEWDAEELKDILLKTSGEKGKQIYVSPKQGQAFVCNMAYVTTLPIELGYTFPIVIPTATGKCVADIINRLDADKLYLHVVEGKYCKVYVEDESFGMSFEIVPANRIHLNTLDRYQGKSYNGVQLTFFKEVLQNVIKSAMAVSASEKVNLKLVKSEETGQVELLVVGSNTNASIENNYKVVTNGFNYEEGDGITEDSVIKEFDIPISLKVLNDILVKCESDYIAFDVCHEENTNAKAIRISEIDLEKVVEESQAVLDGTAVVAEKPAQILEPQEPVEVALPDSVQAVVEEPMVPKAAVNIGEVHAQSTVAPIIKNGKEESFEIEDVRTDAVKTSNIGANEITMQDKVNFRIRTLTSKHYTLAAK